MNDLGFFLQYIPLDKRVDGGRGFLGLIVLTGPINDYYTYRMVYPGRNRKGYPVTLPSFLGGI